MTRLVPSTRRKAEWVLAKHKLKRCPLVLSLSSLSRQQGVMAFLQPLSKELENTDVCFVDKSSVTAYGTALLIHVSTVGTVST